MCEGFCNKEDVPSPKSHDHPLIDPEIMEEPSVKFIGFPIHVGVELKSATGNGFARAVTLIEPLQPAVSVTVTPYVPAVLTVIV